MIQKTRLFTIAANVALAAGHRAEREHAFHPTRKWRFDLAIVPLKIAIEYEGIISSSMSRHTSVKGYTGDCEKYNEAQLLGWIVLRFTALNVKDAASVIGRAIESRNQQTIK